MKLQESAEMYLETIYLLSQQEEGVHAIAVARKMGHSRSTVSEWMAKLKSAEYITIDEEDHIHLTQSGMDIAEQVYNRHTLLENFFTAIGVSPEIAEEDACRVEHYISAETFEKLKTHYEHMA